MVEIHLENRWYLIQEKANKWKIAEKREYKSKDKEGSPTIRILNQRPKYFSSPDKAIEYYFLELRLENIEINTFEKLIEVLEESRKLIKEKLGVVND